MGTSHHKLLHLSPTEWVGFGKAICRGDAVPGDSVCLESRTRIREMVTQGEASFRTVWGAGPDHSLPVFDVRV